MKLQFNPLFLATALLALINTEAFTVTTSPSAQGSMVSAFGGSVLVTGNASPATNSQSGATIEMKKGKANVPAAMRTQYKRQQEMSEMREQMLDAQRPGPDGLPVFNLFVRTKRANMWYPCGSFKGDERSLALCTSYRDEGFLSGISKNQLDSGVAGSLYRDQAQLKETIFRAYPQLRKSKDELEFGYKLAFEGLGEDKTGVNPIVPKEQKGVLDGIKGMFGQ